MKRTKEQIIMLALHYAIQWELSVIDSYRYCRDTYIKDIERSEQNIKDFQRLLKK